MFMYIFAHRRMDLCTCGKAHLRSETFQGSLCLQMARQMYLTGYRGECMYKNVCLYQKIAFLLSAQMLHPFVCARSQEQRFPAKADRNSEVGLPTPSLSLKPPAACHRSGEEWRTPGSLQVLTDGPGLRLRGAWSAGNLGHPVRS